MSAAVLREAAALMRERAEAATPGPWTYEDAPNGFPPMVDKPHLSDAEHIASWHPAVALAVADWLDAQADYHETLQQHGARGLRADGQVPNAFTVARAYLNTPPP